VLLLRDRVAAREVEVEERDAALEDGEEALRARMEAVDLEVAGAVESERARLQQLLADAERVITTLSVGLPEREAALDAREKRLAAQEASLASRERQLRVDHEKQMAVLEAREAQLAQLMASVSAGGGSRDRSRTHTYGTLPDEGHSGQPHGADVRRESGSSAGMMHASGAAHPVAGPAGSGWYSAFSTRPSSAVESSSGGPPSPRARVRDSAAMSTAAEAAPPSPPQPTGYGGRRPSSLQHGKHGTLAAGGAGPGVAGIAPPPPPPVLPGGRADRRDLRVGVDDAGNRVDGPGGAQSTPPSSTRSAGGRGGRAPAGWSSTGGGGGGKGGGAVDGEPGALPAFTRSPPTLRHAQSARSLTSSERRRAAAGDGSAEEAPHSPASPSPRRRDVGAPPGGGGVSDGSGVGAPLHAAGLSMPHLVNAMVGRAGSAPMSASHAPTGGDTGSSGTRWAHAHASASAPASPGSPPYAPGTAFPATAWHGDPRSGVHGPPAAPAAGLRTMSAMPALFAGAPSTSLGYGGPAGGGGADTDWHAYYAARLGMGMGSGGGGGSGGGTSGRW
jgi:hypothetical protein